MLNSYDVSTNETATTIASSPDGMYNTYTSITYIVEDKDIEVGSADIINNINFGATNGVSTGDLLAMQGHILGIKPLPKPYAWLAADVNNSGSITHLDQILTRKIILNIISIFGTVPTFRVVPKYALSQQWDFAAPFENRPFEAFWMDIDNEDRPYKADQNYLHSYLDAIPLNLLNQDALLEETWTFYAVKSGDVNFSFDPNNALSPLEYGLVAEPHDCIPAGDDILVLLSLSEEETLEGFQLGLAFDPTTLSLTGIQQGELTPFGADYISAKKEGKLAALWYNQDEEALKVGDGKVFYELYLNAKKEICNIADHISIDNELLRAEIYCNGIAAPLESKSLKLTVKAEPPKLIVGQAYPNPATGQVTIPFELTEPGTITIQLMDAYGANQMHQATYNAGQYTYTFAEIAHLQPGVLYYQLEINGNIAAGSVIKH